MGEKKKTNSNRKGTLWPFEKDTSLWISWVHNKSRTPTLFLACRISMCVTISVCEWVNCCGHIRNPLWEFFAVWTHDCISGPPRFSCYTVIGWFVYASIKGQLGRKRQTGISATALSVILRFDVTRFKRNTTTTLPHSFFFCLFLRCSCSLFT